MRFLPRRRTAVADDQLVMPAPFQQRAPRPPRMWPRWVALTAGVVLVLVGLWWAWPPLALMVAGAGLAAPALLWDDDRDVLNQVRGGDS